MNSNYDGQGKSEEDEVLGSMRVAVFAMLASGVLVVGGLAFAAKALFG